MTSNAWVMILGIATQALVFHAIPRFSRPDILFAVPVPETFASGVGRTLVAWYRAIVWTGPRRRLLSAC
jgi:hypothetical protein